jgi:hypothetical protein
MMKRLPRRSAPCMTGFGASWERKRAEVMAVLDALMEQN